MVFGEGFTQRLRNFVLLSNFLRYIKNRIKSVMCNTFDYCVSISECFVSSMDSFSHAIYSWQNIRNSFERGWISVLLFMWNRGQMQMDRKRDIKSKFWCKNDVIWVLNHN